MAKATDSINGRRGIWTKASLMQKAHGVSHGDPEGRCREKLQISGPLKPGTGTHANLGRCWGGVQSYPARKLKGASKKKAFLRSPHCGLGRRRRGWQAGPSVLPGLSWGLDLHKQKQFQLGHQLSRWSHTLGRSHTHTYSALCFSNSRMRLLYWMVLRSFQLQETYHNRSSHALDSWSGPPPTTPEGGLLTLALQYYHTRVGGPTFGFWLCSQVYFPSTGLSFLTCKMSTYLCLITYESRRSRSFLKGEVSPAVMNKAPPSPPAESSFPSPPSSSLSSSSSPSGFCLLRHRIENPTWQTHSQHPTAAATTANTWPLIHTRHCAKCCTWIISQVIPSINDLIDWD